MTAATRAADRYFLVLSDGDEAPDSSSRILAQLGARVRREALGFDTRDLDDRGAALRLVVVEPGGRLDRLDAVLGGIDATFDPRPKILIAVEERHVARLPLLGSYDDFVVLPHFPAELYARVRRLEWTDADYKDDQVEKLGDLVVDRAAYDVRLAGRRVPLTRKEFDLLWTLLQERGRALSRERLLDRVWGARYEGGPRTVDIHVRRLRAKLGAALPLVTVRGAGYRVDAR